MIGRLADIWGRKRLYNGGFLVFGFGSLVCGLAQPQFHGGDLILGRVLQGIGGALMVTNSTARVTDAFQKGQVGLGVNQIAGAAGFLIGPALGGLLQADRNAQFEHLNQEVEASLAAGEPVISVDAKKKELVGDFKNAGQEWHPKGEPEEVRIYDFPPPGLGRATPYGVYDLKQNAG